MVINYIQSIVAEKVVGNMNERIKSLDGLKGLFCIPIVFVHYRYIANHYNLPITQLPFFNYIGVFYEKGALFVSPFFWISGFLVEKKYGKSLADMSLLSFIKTRMRVLYPMVFMSVSIGIAISVIDKLLLGREVTAPIDLKWIVLNYTLTHSGWFYQSEYTAYGSGTWFVCVLFLCYIYYYFITKLVPTEFKSVFYIFVFLLGAGGVGPDVMWSPECMCSFFGGVILFRLIYDDENRIIKVNLERKRKNAAFLVIFVLLALCILKYGITDEIVRFYISPFALLSSIEFSPFVRILESRIVQIIGKYSMSTYLSHMHVQRILYIVLALCGTSLTFFNIYVWILVLVFCSIGSIVYYILVQKKFSVFFGELCNTLFI